MNNRSNRKFSNRRARETFWLGVCQEFISSGLGKAEFCVKRKVSDSSLYRWLGYFNDVLGISQSKTPPNTMLNIDNEADKANFVPVKIHAPVEPDYLVEPTKPDVITSVNNPTAELIFPNGLKLSIIQPLDSQLLSQFMHLAG